jgi:hypothetical protein
VGDFDGDEFSMVEVGSEPGVHRLPDFKSMLEAALRGDVVRAGAAPRFPVPQSLAHCPWCFHALRISDINVIGPFGDGQDFW